MRFREYSEKWQVRKLGEVAIKVNSGKTPLGGEKVYSTEGIFFIRSQNINNDRLELDEPIYIPEEVNNGMKNSVVQPNDILLNITGASLGRSCVVPENFTIGNVNQHVCIIRLNKDYSPRFIQPFFSSQKGQNIFLSLQTGSGREGLNFESIKNIQLSFPSISEQEKIASFLSNIDSRIQTQSKIIEGLKLSKQTLIKKIFSQQIKFKNCDGENYSDWKFKKLGEILDYEQPTNYLVSNTEYDNSFETPVVTAGKTFVLGYTNEREGIFEIEKLPVIIFDDFTTASQFVNFRFKAKSSAMKILKAKKGNNIKFIYEALQMINYEIGGHGRHWISVFSNLEIPFPTKEEQNKIANFLSSIDAKIDIETQLLKKLEEQKKFLLQNLFV